jgi:hypothetical protein
VKTAGMTDPNKRYLIYAEIGRGDICGESYYPVPPLRDQGQYALVYLGSNAGCVSRDIGDGTTASAGKAETIAAHEWLHNEGVAPLGAPHYCPGSMYHICTGPLWVSPDLDPERLDIVFPYITDRLSGMTLDAGNDDYFKTSNPYGKHLEDSDWFESV